MQKYKHDVFLWLKHPVISEMREVLDWAHKRALREDIVGHFNRESKLFFRIIVRKGLNRFMAIDRKKYSDLIDIGVHCVRIAEKEYFINCYLSSTLLSQMKRRFALTELMH